MLSELLSELENKFNCDCVISNKIGNAGIPEGLEYGMTEVKISTQNSLGKALGTVTAEYSCLSYPLCYIKEHMTKSQSIYKIIKALESHGCYVSMLNKD